MHGASRGFPIPDTVLRSIGSLSRLHENHGLEIRMLRYLDDWLLLAVSERTCLQVRETPLTCLRI